MKKKLLLAMSGIVLGLSSTVTAYAAPEIMGDGNIFDTEYYAQNNSDVAAVYGTDKNALYQHYLAYGKAEGRLPYAGSPDVSSAGAGDENSLRMGYVMSGFDYDLQPRTERIFYTLENGVWTEHREPLETPWVTDPAAGFVRKDWSGDPGYQAIKNEIVQRLASGGENAILNGEVLSYTQYPRTEDEYKESEQMLKNLSVDLMKSGVVDSCYLSWSATDGYLHFDHWGYEQTVNVFANKSDATTSKYDKHPEIWAYVTIPRSQLYDDTEEVGEPFGSGWMN